MANKKNSSFQTIDMMREKGSQRIVLIYVITIALVLFSCNKSVKGRKIDKKEYTITELKVLNEDFQKALEDIIFNSSCFKKQQDDRYIINISNPLFFKDKKISVVHFLTYCGYDNNDLKDLFGAFYVIYNGSKYLFVIDKNVNIISQDIYSQTEKELDITKYMGAIEEDDADLYIGKENGHLSLVYSLCPNLIKHSEIK